MAVRKTETRIPTGLVASDLGESFVAADGRCALVSFITSPLAVNRENTYVVFVTDAGLAAQAHSFEWSFSENGGGMAAAMLLISRSAGVLANHKVLAL